VSEKRCYSACDTCHHDIKVEKGVRSFCYHCKRIEKVTKRFIYNAEVADCTGAINVKVFSGEISNFINT